jgi:transposase-like protein
MRKTTLTDHDAGKLAAQSLLRNGLATYAEIAAISGRNRQTIRLWIQQLNAENARQDYLAKLWRETLQKVSK